MTLIIIFFASIPLLSLLVTDIEVRRAKRSFEARMTEMRRKGDAEFNRMYDSWLESKAA